MLKKMGLFMLALMLLLAACGDDDGAGSSAEEQALTDAIATGLAADPSQGVTEAEAACIADGTVGALGFDRLTALGVTTENVDATMDAALGQLTPAEQGQVVDVLQDCVDFNATIVEEMKAQGLTDAQAACIGGALTDDMIRSMAIAGMSGQTDYNPMMDPEIGEAFLGVITQCMTG